MGKYFDRIDAQLKGKNSQSSSNMMPSSEGSTMMVDTLLGRMQKPNFNEYFSPENIKDAIEEIASGASEMNVLGKSASSIHNLYDAGEALYKQGEKGVEYLKPGKKAEEFRSTLGSGTSRENISDIGQMVESAAQEEKSLALSPKKEVMDAYSDKRLLPNFSKGEYLKIEDVTNGYSKSGNLKRLHDAYAENPTFQNADKLKSAISKEVREYRPLAKTSDTAKAKLDDLVRNEQAIVKDMDNFGSRLPEKYKGKYNEFKEKYSDYAKTFEEGDKVIQKLADGLHGEITPAKIESTFTKYTPQIDKVLQKMGPDAFNKILYNAVQKVKPGDADGMANTILELKRTKSYDRFISEELENWAKNMKSHVMKANAIKSAIMGSTLGATIGPIAGPVAGTLAGAVGYGFPYAGKLGKGALEIVKRFKK